MRQIYETHFIWTRVKKLRKALQAAVDNSAGWYIKKQHRSTQ